MFVGVYRTTRFAFQNFSRNLWLSLITVFLLILTTFSMTLVVGLNIIGHQVIQAVKDKVEVNLYFHDYVTEEQILDVQAALQKTDGVAQVVYVSKDDALAQYRARHANDPSILAALDALDTNVLPNSVTVRAKHIEDYPKIIARFEQSGFTDLVEKQDYNDNQSIITTITDITQRAYQIGLVVSTIFILISVIVIFNTIRITIYSHREEIGIMQLVGATNWFIRAPFIFEGVILGVIASGITLGIFSVVLVVSDPAMNAFFAGYNFSILGYFLDHAVWLIAGELLAAVLLSVLSSMIAISRYLKV